MGIGKAKDLAEIELDAGDFDFDFADAFGTAESLEIEVFGFLLPVSFSAAKRTTASVTPPVVP